MKTQRLDSLEQYILDNRAVTIDNICKTYHVSKNTVRRDLDELAQRGTIKKVYGGVRATSIPPVKTPLSSFAERHIENRISKEYICKNASTLVSDGDIIFIDTGTTCVNIIEYLKDTQCTIITNSLQVAIIAIPYKNLNLLILPGKLNRDTLSFVGIETVENLQIYNIDKAFMASTGITIENGLTNASPEEYSVKKTAIQNSQSRYLLVDYTKFGRAALKTYCQIADINAIVTDRQPPDEYITYCNNHNVKIIY